MRPTCLLALVVMVGIAGCSGVPLGSDVPTGPEVPTPPSNPGQGVVDRGTDPHFQIANQTISEDAVWTELFETTSCVGSPVTTVGPGDNPNLLLRTPSGGFSSGYFAAWFQPDSSGTATFPVTIHCANGDATATVSLTVLPIPDLRFRLGDGDGPPTYAFSLNGQPFTASRIEQSHQLYRGPVRVGLLPNQGWADRVTWTVGDSAFTLDAAHPERVVDLGTEDLDAVIRPIPEP